MEGNQANITWETHRNVLIVTIDHQHRRNALNPEAHHCLANISKAPQSGEPATAFVQKTLGKQFWV